MYLSDEEQHVLIEKLIVAKSELNNNEIIKLKTVYDEIENGFFSIGDKLNVSRQEILNNINIRIGKFFGEICNLNFVFTVILIKFRNAIS